MQMEKDKIIETIRIEAITSQTNFLLQTENQTAKFHNIHLDTIYFIWD